MCFKSTKQWLILCLIQSRKYAFYRYVQYQKECLFILLNRSRKTGMDSDLSMSEKNKAIEDGQNNNLEPAVHLSG